MIELGTQTCHKVGELSSVSAVRRAGEDIARKLGFNDVRTGELALIITEAATNISKHADNGSIYFRAVSVGDKNGIEIIAVDAGPGMANVENEFLDGNSSAGTYGVGLGAIKRLSHYVDVFTEQGKGTVLLMIIWAEPKSFTQSYWDIGSMCLPLPSEDVCGDSWFANESSNGMNLVIADGLGHGKPAADASLHAISAVIQEPEALPYKLMQTSHNLMKGSRGSAVAIAKISVNDQELRFCGVGNVAGSIYSHEKRQHLISQNGIVGANMHKVNEFVHKWIEGSILIMHSDGIGTKWDLENYPGLESRHSSVIAAVIHRDFTRGRDDSTIVVLKASKEYVH